MKRLVLICFLFHSYLSAAWSGRGADLTYHFTDRQTIVVEASIYKDCNDPAPDVDDLVFGVYSGNAGIECGNYLLKGVKLTSITKSVNACAGPEKTCGTNTYFPHCGQLETYQYQCTLSISEAPLKTALGSGCEWLVFYVKAGTRPFWLNTIQGNTDMYVMAGLNAKNLKQFSLDVKNHSASWFSEPQHTLLLNTKTFINPFAADTGDHDRVVVSLAPATVTLNHTQVQYHTPFSPGFPVTPLCEIPGKVNCRPIPDAVLPRGIFLDSANGNLIFTPTVGEQFGSMVFRATEQRLHPSGKWLTVGFCSREVIYTVTTPGFNRIPAFVNLKRKKSVQPGAIIRDTIIIQDEPLKPYQYKPDSLTFSVAQLPPGARLNLLKDSANYKLFELVWQTDSTHLRPYPYVFYVNASDHHCPFSGVLHVAMSIQVGPEAGSHQGAGIRRAGGNVADVRVNQDLVVLEPDVSRVKLNLYSANGQLLLALSENSGIGGVPLPPGVYFYEITYTKRGLTDHFRGRVCLF